MGKQTIPASAEAMNAMSTAMGALVFAVIRALPSEAHDGFARDLALMAQARSDAGDPIAEMLLIDLHRAAIAAAKP